MQKASNEINNVILNKTGQLSLYIKQVIDYVEKNNSNNIFVNALENIVINDLGWKKEKISLDNIDLLLEYLSYKGILSEKKDRVLRVCPSCKSNATLLECQECGSNNVREVKKIMHHCGYLDISDGFFHGDNLLCPLCGEVIGFGNDGVNGEYRFSDSVYQCVDCGSQVSKYKNLDEVVSCLECGEKYSEYKTNFITYYQVIKI